MREPPFVADTAPVLLTVNGGSSSIKCALFAGDEALGLVWSGTVSGIGTPAARLDVTGQHGSQTIPIGADGAAHATAVQPIIEALHPHLTRAPLAGIVHRVVHGGERFDRPQRVTASVIAGLRELIPLAPNHLPDEIVLIETFLRERPQTPQVVCFDTVFHRHLPLVSRTLPVPETPGLRRYGFHGLSYAYLLGELERIAGAPAAAGRVVLAHLGSGASLAAVAGGRCVDTSMGLTPAGGVVMSSRPGDLDPGVVGYLARLRMLSLDQVDHLLTHESGLRAISGRSADMQDLLAREGSDPRARLAVDVFCYQVRKWIGAFAAALGGLDTLVFSGGIGEHAPAVRRRICGDLSFLGVQLAEDQNAIDAALISTPAGRVAVRVMPTNEALMMAREARTVLRETTT
jgi:acetate kinase